MTSQQISTRTPVRRIVVLHAILSAALLALGAAPAVAANQKVEVGQFTSSGTIALQLPKFHEQFADGTKIAEITVADFNGYRVVSRKGYAASGACRIETAPITTGDGQPIPSHFVAAAGTRVFLPTLISVTLSGCVDNRCGDLAGVDGLGGHETLRAWCDRTELSDNICRCHVVTTEAVGIQLADNALGLCTSWLDRLTSAQVSEWIRFRYVG